MSLGLESGIVRLVPYDPAWPGSFAAEAERLQKFFSAAGLVVLLEHTGSTAIPGLPAKPILDILAGFPKGARGADYIHALLVGYRDPPPGVTVPCEAQPTVSPWGAREHGRRRITASGVGERDPAGRLRQRQRDGTVDEEPRAVELDGRDPSDSGLIVRTHGQRDRERHLRGVLHLDHQGLLPAPRAGGVRTVHRVTARHSQAGLHHRAAGDQR